jgi:hypothetical protein
MFDSSVTTVLLLGGYHLPLEGGDHTGLYVCHPIVPVRHFVPFPVDWLTHRGEDECTPITPSSGWNLIV